MRIENYVLRVRLINYVQTDDDDCPYLHAEFASMANNSECVEDLNDNVPLVEIMARKRLDGIAIYSNSTSNGKLCL
jgi:hypothetical protein